MLALSSKIRYFVKYSVRVLSITSTITLFMLLIALLKTPKKNVGDTGRCSHVSEGILCRVCRLPAMSAYARFLSIKEYLTFLIILSGKDLTTCARGA